MSDYTPRAGSKAYLAVQYFQQNSEQALRASLAAYLTSTAAYVEYLGQQTPA
jgi:hypothetical protein